jgi:hypothetical protein
VTEEESDTRGMSILGMSMGLSLLSMLVSKGIFNSAETERYLEGVLTSLEGFQEPSDPGMQKARKLFEAISGIVRAQSQQPT